VRIPPVRARAVASWPGPADAAGGGGLQEMADMAYVLVCAGGFGLLALVLRGLERL
jgi:hypothetical protein